jgi:hypothetical protein
MDDRSYAEYIATTGKNDSRESWIDWKVVVCGMSRREATKAAHEPGWGWEPGLATKKWEG